MKPTQLRMWIRKYGNAGILMVAAYLGLRHLVAKRRLLLGCFFLVTMMGILLCCPRHHSIVPVALPSHREEKAVSDLVVDLPAGTEQERLDESLIAAVRQNHFDKVQAALRAGANVDARDEVTKTALMLAAEKASEEIVRLLLRSGADVNATSNALEETDAGWQCAIYFAVHNKRTEVVRLLIQCGADVRDESLVIEATANKSKDILHLLLTHGADVNVRDKDMCTPLMNAVEGRDMDMIRFLIAHHADIEAGHRTSGNALTIAAENGNLPLVKYLVAHGGDVNANPAFANMLCAASDHPDILRYLLRKGVDVNEPEHYNVTPLLCAASDGNVASVRLLLKYGAKIDVEHMMTHETPLMKAVKEGHTEVVKLLLQWGAKVNLATENDYNEVEGDLTALKFARIKGNQDIIKLLEKAGAKE